MPKRDPLAAAIAQATLAMPPAPAPVVDEDPNAPVHLQVLDAIYSAPDDEEAEAVGWLDAVLMLMATTPWAALSDENHSGLIASLEHTCSVSIPGHRLPCISGAVPGAWGPISGPIAARCIEHMAIADDSRAADVRSMWARLQRFTPGEQALTWATRALLPFINAAQAEVAGWPASRRQAAAARLEDLR